MEPADRISRFIKTLPPLVAIIVWDVLNGLITESTITLANQATEEEYQAYEIIRFVSVANSQNPPILQARSIVNRMMKDIN